MIPNKFVMELQRWDVNGVTLSEVIALGMLNLLIHPWKRAFVHDCMVASVIGITLNHLVEQSKMVNRYLYLSNMGKGPMMLTYMCPNLLLGEKKI